MSETRIHDFIGWSDCTIMDFLGKHPVRPIDSSNGGWLPCKDAHSLSSMCTLIAKTIFGEDDRDNDVKCPVCQKLVTEIIPHDITESTLTIREEVHEEERTVTVVTLKDGTKLQGEGEFPGKVGEKYQESTVESIGSKKVYEVKVEVTSELFMPNEDKPLTESVEMKSYTLDAPYQAKPTVKVSYQMALDSWEREKEVELEELSSKTSKTARPVLEDWETREYAPLIKRLIASYIGEDRGQGKFQLHMAKAREIRDIVREELRLPLGHVEVPPRLPDDVKPIHPSAELDDPEVGSADASQCCLAQVGSYNILLASLVTSLLLVYGFSKGYFDSLLQNLRGTDSSGQKTRHGNSIPFGPPETPYKPFFGGGMPTISVYN